MPPSTSSARSCRRSGSASSCSASCGGHLGFRPPEARRALVGRPVARHLAGARGRLVLWRLPRLGEPPAHRQGRSAPPRPGDAADPAAAEGPDRVLLPVPAAGRALLRRAALPLGGARPQRHRHRPADHAAVDHPAARRRRGPEAVAARVAASGGSARVPLALRRHRVPAGCSRGRRGRRDRHRAAAPRRPRHRRARLPARRGDRLGGARRADRRGGRPPEHVHQPGGLDRHRAGRRRAHLRPHRVVLHGHRRERGGAAGGHLAGPGASSRAGCPSCPTPSSRLALDEAGVDEATATAIVEENTEARLDGLRSALAVLALLALVAFFTSGGLPTRQPGSAEPEPTAEPGTDPAVSPLGGH